MQEADEYRELFETMSLGVLFQDADGVILSANPAASAILGLDSEQLTGCAFSRLPLRAIGEDGTDFPDAAQPAMVALSTGQPAPATIIGVFNPQRVEYRWVRMRTMPLAGASDDHPRLVYSIFSDITNEKKAEVAIKKEHDFASEIFNIIASLLVVMDKKGEIVLFNRACELLTGYSFDEVKGRHVWDFLLLPEEAEAVKAVFYKLKAGNFPNSHENCWVSREGVIRNISWSNSSVADEDGSVEFIIATGIDITDRKRAEQALNVYREHLEELVDARTHEVNAVNRELEAFSYSVSHDLRAPLRSIDGFSLALIEEYADQLDEQAQDYLRRVREGTKRMGQLIEDLLKLSRVTRSEMHLERIDLSNMVNSIIDDFRLADPQRKLELDIESGLCTRGDARLLRIVLENLFGNAWKFTRKKETAHISFTCKNIEGVETYVVKDNGAGFDMNYTEKLFGTFQRLHSMEEFEGTGIGLATVKRIIQRHGGEIWAEGKPDEGAIFYFQLAKQNCTDPLLTV